MTKRSTIRRLFVGVAAALVGATAVVGYNAYAAPVQPLISADLEAAYGFNASDGPRYLAEYHNHGPDDVPASLRGLIGGYRVSISVASSSPLRLTGYRVNGSTTIVPCGGDGTRCVVSIAAGFPDGTASLVDYFYTGIAVNDIVSATMAISSGFNDPNTNNNQTIIRIKRLA